jgi:hypothetical protein
MAVQRTNPLPVGFYWIDVFTPPPGPKAGDIREYMDWIGDQSGKVTLLDAHTEPGGDGSGGVSDRSHLWTNFEVHEPVDFPFGRFGFPTKSTRDTKESDTAHNLPTSISDMIDEFLAEHAPDVGSIASGATKIAVAAAFGLSLAWGVAQIFSRRK